MSGAGLFEAGAWPAGYGVPETAPFSPTSPLPSSANGLTQTGRYIDQRTGDYVMQDDGRLQGMPTVAQLVLLALKGVDLSGLREKGPNFKARLTALVTSALAPLVAQKLVRVRQVIPIEPSSDSGFAFVDWTDLTTNAPAQTTIGA